MRIILTSSLGINLRQLALDDADEMYKTRVKNRSYLQPFEPRHSDALFSPQGIVAALQLAEESFQKGTSYGFAIRNNDQDPIIGRITLSNVVQGAWQSCTVGYFVDQDYTGCGIATEALRLAVHFAFTHAELHRVQAAIMPHNLPSLRVIKKVGFHHEGLAKYYLKINGRWEDHQIFSLTKELYKQ